MKFAEKTILKITDVDKKGRGCATVGNRMATIPFAVPGEEVEAILISRKKGELQFRGEKLITASPHRITPRCPYVGTCGGCAWQQFDYPYQLELKRNLINRTLAAGDIMQRIGEVIPSPAQFYYRNRMDYCVGPHGELGLKEPGRWNAYLNLDTCYLLSPESVQIMQRFREYMVSEKLTPWDNVQHTGFVRYLVIREGKNTGKRMVTIVTSQGDLPAHDKLIATLSPLATTIYHGINPTITDLSIAPQLTLLHGEQFLEERVGKNTFLIHPNSFFQTNTVMAEKLVETVASFLAPKKPKTLLDLYCGVGLFGLSLASTADRVFGVEIDAEAIALATKNATAKSITNAEFVADKAEGLIWEKEKPDTVIVDPPRSGLHPKVVESLLTHLPQRIAYVSCNYESFVHDFSKLRQSYDITCMEALDLFPHSPHVEVVSLLELQ